MLGSQTTAQFAIAEDLNVALGFNNSVVNVPDAPIAALVCLIIAIGLVLGIKHFS